MTDKATNEEPQIEEESTALPSWLASFDSSMFRAPVPLSAAEIESRKTQVFDLMSEAAELDEESSRLGSQKGTVDKVLRDKQADARRMAYEARFKVRTEDVECVRVPLVDEGVVVLRRSDIYGMPVVAIFDLGDQEAESAGQIKLNAKSRGFIAKTASLLSELGEDERTGLHRG